MAKSSSYSMKNVVVTLDGILVQGLWDGDDAVSVTPGADIGSLLVGADGGSIFSQSPDQSATISLKLMDTSPMHRILTQKLRAQMGGDTRRMGFPFDLKDIGSGGGGNTAQAFIQRAPTESKGKTATMREWTLITGSWDMLIPNNS